MVVTIIDETVFMFGQSNFGFTNMLLEKTRGLRQKKNQCNNN